ncbi:uncharacterized protein IAS62_004799 [Cryptococcus decagattii]|uniref:Fe2OG dioxygenase domain-containing protein n=1 Tax=Cryptococcus decagattii TaxID=1859122 RepID=A0ABZ2B3Y2_9TREE
MVKDKKQNKKRKLNGRVNEPKPIASLPTPPGDTSSSSSLIEPEELETAIYVLKTLCEFPEELSDKKYKELKRSVYDLHRVMADGATLGASLTSKISAALQDYRFSDALILLFEMYTRRLAPKLGALQRWVRECDATSAADGSPGDPEALKCLDLILRIANMTNANGQAPSVPAKSSSSVIHHKKPWVARGPIEGEIAIWERMQKGTLFDGETPPKPYPNFRPVHHVPAAERRPPNLYDSTVYGSSPSAITLTPKEYRPRQPSKMVVPGVPGAFMVLDVFTPEECLQIVKAAEAIGFDKDEAAAGSAIMKTSILARNFVWLADKPFLEHFFAQILPFVPQTAHVSPDGQGGGKVRGINARFRVYQYNENQLYRPHIDGAWPAAGLHPETGEYLHDSSPPDDPLWSRYTLLVYLNSDIPDDTGCTTFFLPSETMGVMDATSVKPVQGAVLCFPHGDTQGSLLHEGSAVGAGGGKLVIRTELLFEAQGFGQFKPPTNGNVTAQS